MNQQKAYEIPLIVRARSDGKKTEVILERPEGSQSIGPGFTSKYLHQQDFSVGLFKLGDMGVVSIHWRCIPFKPLDFHFEPPFDKKYKLIIKAKIDGDKGNLSLVSPSTDNQMEYGNKIVVLDSKTYSIHLGEINDKNSAVLYQQSGDPILLDLGDYH